MQIIYIYTNIPTGVFGGLGGAPLYLARLRPTFDRLCALRRSLRALSPSKGGSTALFGAYGSLGGPFGLRFRSIFGRFRGRAGVPTKNARHAIRMRHGERIACRGVLEGPGNRPKIAPGASRERLSEKIAQKRRLESARAPFSSGLARFGVVLGSSWVSFTSFVTPRASPGVVRERPDGPRIGPDGPAGPRERFCSIFGRFLLDFRSISA